jgi:AraC family transcriptional regulator
MSSTRPPQSFYEWVMNERCNPYLLEARAAKPLPVTFFATRQHEAFPDPATPDLNLTLLTAGTGENIACDFDCGRFLLKAWPGEMAIAPAYTDCDYHGGGSTFELLITAFPHRLVKAVIERATERDFTDFAELHARSFRDSQIEQLLRQMWCEAATDNPHGRLYMDGAMTLTLARLLQLAKDPLPAITARSRLRPVLLKRLSDYIDAHLDEPLGLDDLAEVAHMSRFHFARLFKQTTHETPHQYVTRRRLEEAQRQLRDTDASIVDIALAVGFSSATHFAHQFKRRFGVTPSAFRQAQ